MRQAGDIFLNGKQVGLYENGVTAYGIDITDALRFDGKENVLAVKVDNTTSYKERPSAWPTPRTLTAPPAIRSIRVECERLQPRPRRHQPARVAARDRQDLPDAAALLRP